MEDKIIRSQDQETNGIEQKINLLHNTGLNYREIAQKLNVTLYKIYVTLKKDQLDVGGSNRKKRVLKALKFSYVPCTYDETEFITGIDKRTLKNLDVKHRQKEELACGLACTSFLMEYLHLPIQVKQGNLLAIAKSKNYIDELLGGIKPTDIVKCANLEIQANMKKENGNKNGNKIPQFKTKTVNHSQLLAELQNKNLPIILLIDGPSLRSPRPDPLDQYGHFIVLLKAHQQYFLIWDPDQDEKTGGFFITSPINLMNARNKTTGAILTLDID